MQDPPVSPPLFTRRDLALFSLISLVIVALILLLNFPTANVNVPDWLPVLQQQLRDLINAVIPYLIVGLLGAIVAIAELTSTFQTYPREALQTRWARILVFINICAAILALIVVRVTMPAMNPVLQVLAVGVGFQSLIRTRFVLAKPIGDDGKGEVSLNLGWLYDQFQNLCRTQIDLELMNNRRTAVTRLLTYYPSLAELYDIAWYTIIARATLTAAEEAARIAELEKLLDPKAPEQFARTSIALMVLENGGPGYVNLLTDQAMTAENAAYPAMLMTTERLVRQLVETHTLDGLVAFAKSLTDSGEVITWIECAARPDQDSSEATRKAAIAHFLIQQIGVEIVQHAMLHAQTTAPTPAPLPPAPPDDMLPEPLPPLEPPPTASPDDAPPPATP
ncbi:MAG: hypothetical protein KC425_15155 [Anaerolineales bacterium]|nr:hypothetical protein [Anaerolineales bacterium]